MRMFPAAAAALIDIEIDCINRQQPVNRTQFTPFTLIAANSAYVVRDALGVNEQRVDTKRI